jgi:hypothetical protein
MRLMLKRVLVSIAVSAPLAEGTLCAQDSELGRFARMVVLAPKPGRDADFEAGYERHLAWHRSHRDPWTWYGWSFVLGNRLGQFMDGTFGHAAADFDHPVNPAGDAADNKANVTPVADFLSHGVYERLVESSRGPALPDTTAFLVMTIYHLAPGRAAEFERLLRERAKSPARSGAEARYSWYRLRLGGDAPQYVLMRAVPSWEAAAGLSEPVADAAGAMLERVTVELLRYRPTLSYRP